MKKDTLIRNISRPKANYLLGNEEQSTGPQLILVHLRTDLVMIGNKCILYAYFVKQLFIASSAKAELSLSNGF